MGQENGVRFWKSEEAYEVGCDIGAKLQQRDEDTTPFHESVTTFPTICVAREWPEQQAFVEWTQRWNDPFQQPGSTDLPVPSDHIFKLVLTIDHNCAYTSIQWPKLRLGIDQWPQAVAEPECWKVGQLTQVNFFSKKKIFVKLCKN